MSKQIYLYCPKGVFLTNGGIHSLSTAEGYFTEKDSHADRKNELRVGLNEIV